MSSAPLRKKLFPLYVCGRRFLEMFQIAPHRALTQLSTDCSVWLQIESGHACDFVSFCHMAPKQWSDKLEAPLLTDVLHHRSASRCLHQNNLSVYIFKFRHSYAFLRNVRYSKIKYPGVKDRRLIYRDIWQIIKMQINVTLSFIYANEIHWTLESLWVTRTGSQVLCERLFHFEPLQGWCELYQVKLLKAQVCGGVWTWHGGKYSLLCKTVPSPLRKKCFKPWLVVLVQYPNRPHL